MRSTAAPLLFSLAVLTLAAAVPAPVAAASRCDRACLYGVLDAYLNALKAKDPALAPWAAKAVTSENNVVLAAGDGLWGTVTGLAIMTCASPMRPPARLAITASSRRPTRLRPWPCG